MWEEGQDPVTFIDVHEEFSTSVVEKFKILKFKCKVSQSLRIIEGTSVNKSVISAGTKPASHLGLMMVYL